MPGEFEKRYRIIDKLGEGGIAKVYKAEDTVLGRIVAIKLLREQYKDDQAFLTRFQREARAAASLSHHHIVSVYDFGDDSKLHYIVMEYVEGRTLRDVMNEKGPLPIPYALTIAHQVCSALQYAHDKQIVHRDIKPENIILLEGDRAAPAEKPLAKITDFGIARALGEASFSNPREILGTAQYLSPEQAEGTEITGASDIYSMGVVLYEMLTGKVPFQGDSPLSTALKHMREHPIPPHQLNPKIPPALESIVLKAMAKDTRNRFSSAAEMGEVLLRYLEMGEAKTGIIRMPTAAATRPAVPTQRPHTRPAAQAAGGGGFDWFLLFFAILLAVLLIGLGVLGVAVYRAYSAPAAPPASPTTPPAATPTSTAEPTPRVLILLPGIVRLDNAQARSLIEGLGLTYRELASEFSNDIPAGQVMRQEPQAGSSLEPGTSVLVVVSKGPEKVAILLVAGLKQPEAEVKLKELGLKVAIKQEWNKDVEAGTVYGQEPVAGMQVSRDSTVTLTVSKGPEMVAVPDVVGLQEAEAKRRIAETRLRNFQWVNYQGHDVLPDSTLKAVCIGCVLSSTPAGGTMVEPGTEIKIAVRKD